MTLKGGCSICGGLPVNLRGVLICQECDSMTIETLRARVFGEPGRRIYERRRRMQKGREGE